MIFFFIFIILLSIYEINYIIKNENDTKIPLITIYCFITVMVSIIGVYYYLNQYGNSLSYYMFKVLNIHY